MDRIVYIKIDDKDYPLCCTLGAFEQIQTQFGGIEKFADKCIKERDVHTYIKALAILMRYGAGRLKRYEGKEIEPLSYDDLAEILTLDDFADVESKVWETINKSKKNEIAGKSQAKKKAAE